MIVVADTSPLITLARIGRLELLRTMFGKPLLTEAVCLEVVAARWQTKQCYYELELARNSWGIF